MKLLNTLLEQLFGGPQAGGETMLVEISMRSAIHCSQIVRVSTCGGDCTTIKFNPPLQLEVALLEARAYTEKGVFTHTK